jgi:hypothetical protein
VTQTQEASYRLFGLQWGIGADAARARLQQAGFRVVGLSEGPREEFVVRGLHAALAATDRGRRLVANGKIAGQAVTLDLAFGQNDRLHHAGITSRYWDGTVADARALIDLATRLVMLYEETYGPARKRKADGWIDTAIWPRAKDGSSLSIAVRGVEGFMFSPSYKTALKAEFALGSPSPVGTEARGAPLPMEKDAAAEQPRPLMTEKELQKEYQKDPAAIDPPPPRGLRLP